MTPELMLRLYDDGLLYELVDGQLVEKHRGDFAHLVANTVGAEISLWARRSGQGGRSFIQGRFQCFEHAPGMVRRPDVAYIAGDRLAAYRWGRDHFMIVPDLVVELVSPRDPVYELDRKIADYLRAGVRRVWVINPEQQTVRIHRGPVDLSEFVADADLTDEAVLPGFRCNVSALFVQPAAAAAPLPAQPAT